MCRTAGKLRPSITSRFVHASRNIEDFEREVYGRRPAAIPKVTWGIATTTEGMSGEVPTVVKQLVGHVDNSAFPAISVNIQASLTTPKNATGPVPVVMIFSGGGFGGPLGRAWEGVTAAAVAKLSAGREEPRQRPSTPTPASNPLRYP